ncbi:MAG: alcohol dehydrogenase [Legionellales bacterium]|nr:alcohol dehydrogenase [Legionellales bacterium]
MRAVGFYEFGDPDVLQVIDLPEVHAEPGQVRIRNFAATINPTDLLTRNGSRFKQMEDDPAPYVPGMEVAGVVDEVGDDVKTGVKVGDKVIGIVVTKGNHGGYREQIVLNARSVVPLPAGKSFVEACTLPMNGLTARQVLDRIALRPGQTIAVTGAAGAFGGYVVQLAKAAGLTVIADASIADEALVTSFGADIVVLRGDGFSDRVREHFPDGVDAIADGAVLSQKVTAAVKDGGVFNSLRGWQGTGERGMRFETTSVRSYAFEFDKLNKLRQQVEEGVLTLRVAGHYRPEEAPEAHRRLETGGVKGRLVIEF